MKSKVAKLINDQVDWAEWGKDDSEGNELADKIIEEFIAIVEAEYVGEDLCYPDWEELKERLRNE